MILQLKALVQIFGTQSKEDLNQQNSFNLLEIPHRTEHFTALSHSHLGEGGDSRPIRELNMLVQQMSLQS